MKILYFIGSLRSGGKERRLIELISALKEKTNYEFLLVLAFNQIDYEYFHELGIDYISINKKQNRKSIKVYFQLNQIIKRFKPDIIHTWGSMQSFYIFPIAILRKIPLINGQITDAPLHIKKFSFQNFVNKINFTFSSIILANSEAGLKAYNVDKYIKSRFIYNGFDFVRIAQLIDPLIIRKKFSISTKHVICMVASFSEKKDYTTYIMAATKILDLRQDITFLCVGSGNDKPYTEMVYDEIEDNIKFLGKQQNVESIMNACDIGILMSNPQTHGEGISNAIMEFMSLGKPVIASQSGGNNEIILHEQTGFIVQPYSLDSLTKKVLFLLENPIELEKMGKAGNERIKKHFHINKMVDSFINIYNGIIEERQ